jgi:hypothetical protein
MKTVKMKNYSTQPVTVSDLGIHSLAPGGCCEVPVGYALPGLTSNGSRRPSTIELLAPQLQPANEQERVRWLKTPTGPEPEVRGVEERCKEGSEPAQAKEDWAAELEDARLKAWRV